MMSFKKYLAESYSLHNVELDRHSDESGLPQLTPEQTKIYTKFITLLGRWLDDGTLNKKDQLTLIKLTDQIDKRITQEKGLTKLYRGLWFYSKQEFKTNDFLFPDKLEYKPNNSIESWTTSKNVATDFAMHHSFPSTFHVSVIIEKTFNPDDILMNVLNVVTNDTLSKIAQYLKKERFSSAADDNADKELEVMVKNKLNSTIKIDKIYYL